jgi:hypothetical protein
MNILGFPGSKRQKVTNHFDLQNIGQNTHVELDALKVDYESKIDQDLKTTASPNFANLTAGNLTSTSTIQTQLAIIDTNDNATLSFRRNGTQKWLIENDASLSDTLIVKNLTNEPTIVVQPDNTVKFLARVSVGQEAFVKELDIDNVTDTSLNFRKNGGFSWAIESQGNNDDTLVFYNKNIDNPLTMSLTQDSELKLGDLNPYIFPVSIGTSGSVLTSNGVGNLEFKLPLSGRYVQASTQNITTINNTTSEIIFTNPFPSGVGQLRIDGSPNSLGGDTYQLVFRGQLITQQNSTEVRLRIRDSNAGQLFIHAFQLENTNSAPAAIPFEYHLTISRFEEINFTNRLRIDGVLDYRPNNRPVERIQTNTSVEVANSSTIDFNLSWQFLNDQNTTASFSSVIFQRVF